MQAPHLLVAERGAAAKRRNTCTPEHLVSEQVADPCNL